MFVCDELTADVDESAVPKQPVEIYHTLNATLFTVTQLRLCAFKFLNSVYKRRFNFHHAHECDGVGLAFLFTN